MLLKISLTGWIIFFFVLFIIWMNVWLFTSLKKDRSKGEIEIFKRVTKAIKDPFAQENQQLDDLSLAISSLRKDISELEDLGLESNNKN